MAERGRLTEDGDLIPVPGMRPRMLVDVPDIDPGRYWAVNLPAGRLSRPPKSAVRTEDLPASGPAPST